MSNTQTIGTVGITLTVILLLALPASAGFFGEVWNFVNPWSSPYGENLNANDGIHGNALFNGFDSPTAGAFDDPTAPLNDPVGSGPINAPTPIGNIIPNPPTATLYKVTFDVRAKSTDTAIAGAKVILSNTAGITGNDGIVQYTNALAGTHDYTVSANGYQTETGKAIIDGDTTIIIKLLKNGETSGEEEIAPNIYLSTANLGAFSKRAGTSATIVVRFNNEGTTTLKEVKVKAVIPTISAQSKTQGPFEVEGKTEATKTFSIDIPRTARLGQHVMRITIRAEDGTEKTVHRFLRIIE